MKEKSNFLLLVVVGLLGVIIGLLLKSERVPVTQAQKTEAARQFQPNKWDYVYIVNKFTNRKDSFTSVGVTVVWSSSGAVDWVEGKDERESFNNALRKLGNEGYEMVGIGTNGFERLGSFSDGNGEINNPFVLYFKRPKPN